MKILVAHNYYRSENPSGENRVVESERAMLAAQGHEVRIFARNSDEIGGTGVRGQLAGGLATPWNPAAASAIADVAAAFRPDIVHVHNTFPLISPSIFHALRSKAPVVLTLHNYRLFCSAAIPMREGRSCTECLDRRSAWPSIRHGCYRDSRLATLPIAAGVELHRALGTWDKHVAAFITLSEFQRDLMVKAGLPASRVHVKPNFQSIVPDVKPWAERRGSVVFAGRLSAEKGVLGMVRAWKLWGPDAPELVIVGDGPLRAELEAMAQGLPIRFLGRLPHAEVQKVIADARLMLFPSEWFETFGLVVLEAFSLGVPVAASAIGPLPALVRDGLEGTVFPPNDPPAMLARVRALWEEPETLAAMGDRARETFLNRFTERANYERLREIYDRAISTFDHD